VPFCYYFSVSLYWLSYQRDGKVEVVIQPGGTLIFAHVGAGIAGLDQGTFAEGHALDEATAVRVPANMVGKRLSANKAEKLLNALDHPSGAKREQKRPGAKSDRR
jgi:hypothetical protein